MIFHTILFPVVNETSIIVLKVILSVNNIELSVLIRIIYSYNSFGTTLSKRYCCMALMIVTFYLFINLINYVNSIYILILIKILVIYGCVH